MNSVENAVFRIIDANFNRGREAARVMEEFCRFALNNASLSGRAKQLRHELSAAVEKLDLGRLIASRDTSGDVGCGLEVDNQLQRSDLLDCLTAACKRLTEALRVLAEMSQALDPEVAKKIETLRYTAYTLEKDILLAHYPAEKFKSVRLYVILSDSFPVDIIRLARSCIAGGADCIQLRVKNMHDNELLAIAKEVAAICKDAGVLSIINDRVDIAVAADADGVHLGQEDLPLAEARKSQSKPMIFGKSTHSLDQLSEAIEQAAVYVGLGPVFATVTKPDYEVAGLGYVKQATAALKNTGISHVAIGGITLDNIDKVLAAGAEAIAVCSVVYDSADPAELCLKLKKKMLSYEDK